MIQGQPTKTFDGSTTDIRPTGSDFHLLVLNVARECQEHVGAVTRVAAPPDIDVKHDVRRAHNESAVYTHALVDCRSVNGDIRLTQVVWAVFLEFQLKRDIKIKSI